MEYYNFWIISNHLPHMFITAPTVPYYTVIYSIKQCFMPCSRVQYAVLTVFLPNLCKTQIVTAVNLSWAFSFYVFTTVEGETR